MQGDISSNDSSLSSVKYWWKDINVGFTLDWIASATKQTKIIKTVGFRQVKKSPLLLRIIFGDSDFLLFKGYFSYKIIFGHKVVLDT